MLVAILCSSIVSSADTNDAQLGPSSVSLTLSSPLNQAAMHAWKQLADIPLWSASISLSLGSYSPNCRPNLSHTAHDKC